MSEQQNPQCSKVVYNNTSFRGKPCKRIGKVERDGKWYCVQHDPVSVKEKQDAKNKQWQVEWEERQVRLLEQQKELAYQQAAAAYCRALGMTFEDMTS